MSNRIDLCFERLRREKRKAFIPYICAGDPTLDATVELSRGLEEAGADILELGLPFSDPLADGIVNQLAAQRALSSGATVRGVLQCVQEIRKASQIPIVLYTYMNPIVAFGWEKFHSAAESAGIDGLLILDLPPDEKMAPSGTDNLVHIRLVAPTTAPSRMRQIAEGARGFLYYVSREGVTGAGGGLGSFAGQLGELRKASPLPIAVGFGISTPEQAKAVARDADAVVVGSAIVAHIAEHGGKKDLVERVGQFVTPLIEATKSV